MSGNNTLNVLDQQVTVLPLSSVTSVGIEETSDLEGVIESDQHLLVSRDICVPRRLPELRGGKAEVMLTNFSNERKNVNKGTIVTFIEEIVQAGNSFALPDFTEPSATTQRPEPAFVINLSLPQHGKEQINVLFRQYKDWTSSS